MPQINSLQMFDHKVRSHSLSKVRSALCEMVEEAKVSPIRQGFFPIARRALAVRNDEVYWLAATVLSYFVEKYPAQLLRIIRSVAQDSSDDQRTALAKCILEHLMENHFDDVINMVSQETDAELRYALVDILARCWPFGEAEKKSNWERVESLVREYPQFSERANLSFMLRT